MQITKISAISNPKIRFLYSLQSKSNVIANNKFLVEGKHLIEEAYKNKILEELLIIDENSAKEYAVNKILVNAKIIQKLSNHKSNADGIIGVCKYEQNNFALEGLHKIIVLDQINNPGNLGTIIRTAKAFNFDAVILLNNSVFPYNFRTIQSSQGAIFDFKIKSVEDLSELKEFYPYYFVLGHDALKISQITNFKQKSALVFGNEANGISEKLIKFWEGQKVFIEIANVESLNISVACGIAAYLFKIKQVV